METIDTNKTELVSFRFHKALKRKLVNLSEATGQSQSFLAEEAIMQYCDLQSWQVNAINHGIEAAKEGRFVSHEKIKEKWKLKRENLMD